MFYIEIYSSDEINGIPGQRPHLKALYMVEAVAMVTVHCLTKQAKV